MKYLSKQKNTCINMEHSLVTKAQRFDFNACFPCYCKRLHCTDKLIWLGKSSYFQTNWQKCLQPACTLLCLKAWVFHLKTWEFDNWIPTGHNYCLVPGAPLHLLAAVWSQPWRPAGARDREALQDGRGQVQRVRQGVDQEVCHVILGRRQYWC